jgi:hypothetical protein
VYGPMALRQMIRSIDRMLADPKLPPNIRKAQMTRRANAVAKLEKMTESERL